MVIETRRMSGEARKKQIVRVALKVIGKHGVEGASIARIAKGAGITTAALYVHFENRQAILLAALDAVYDQIFQCHVAPAGDTALERMRAIMNKYEAMVTDQGASGFARFFMEFVVAAADRVLRDAVREKMLAVDAKWIGYVGEGKVDGSIAQDVDAEEVALRIAGWAWSGHVALLVGRQATWYPKLSTRVAERILQDISASA